MRRTVKRDGYLDFLAKLRPFAACSPAELRAIGRGSTLVPRGAGTVLARQGAPLHEFFVLASGSALVVRDELPDVVLSPGDWFGDADLLAKRVATATVVALTDVQVVVMSRREFVALFESVGSFRRRLVTALATSRRAP